MKRKSPAKYRPVCGVGVNDADYEVYLDGKPCPYYKRWADMLRRCYVAAKSEKLAYKDCSVCTEWLTFSNFKSWMQTQDWVGKELDKDLLGDGKLYSPDTCCFIEHSLNKFIACDYARTKTSGLPLGVRKSGGGYRVRADCWNPITRIQWRSEPTYCPEEAHLAWKTKKHEFACMLADLQEDQRIAEALRKRYL